MSHTNGKNTISKFYGTQQYFFFFRYISANTHDDLPIILKKKRKDKNGIKKN